MNDLHIQHVENITITSASNRHFQPPRLLITSQQFAAGFTSGFSSAINAQLSNDERLSDEDIIAAAKIIFFDEGVPTDSITATSDEIAYAVGAFVGEIIAKC